MWRFGTDANGFVESRTGAFRWCDWDLQPTCSGSRGEWTDGMLEGIWEGNWRCGVQTSCRLDCSRLFRRFC